MMMTVIDNTAGGIARYILSPKRLIPFRIGCGRREHAAHDLSSRCISDLINIKSNAVTRFTLAEQNILAVSG
jgi:hypothetical protein